MARRTARVRFSTAIWLGEITGSFDQNLRSIWLPLLQSYSWQDYGPQRTEDLVQALLKAAKYPEFRHLPPFQAYSETLQGGAWTSLQHTDVPSAEPRFLPLRVAARGRPFHVAGAGDFDVSGRIGAQLFLSGYLIVELEFRLRAEAALIASDTLWECIRLLNPKEARSPIRFSKRGCSAWPREFAAEVIKGFAHSLMGTSDLTAMSRLSWHTGIMAEEGPDRAPGTIIGDDTVELTRFAAGPLQAGVNGYYYRDNPHIAHRAMRRRYATLTAILDFARYQRDCFVWAKAATAERIREIEQALLEGGPSRLMFDVGAVALFAKTLREFIQLIDSVMSSNGSNTSRWQRRIYSALATPLRIVEVRDKYKERSAELMRQILTLRGRDAAHTTRTNARDIDIFISYAREDYARIAPLKANLESIGLSVWLDQDRGIEAGDWWQIALSDALMGAKVVLACWSKTALISDWVRNECGVALQLKKLVPVALEPIEAQDIGLLMIASYEDVSDFDVDQPHRGWARALRASAKIMRSWCDEYPEEPQTSELLKRAERLHGHAEQMISQA